MNKVLDLQQMRSKSGKKKGREQSSASWGCAPSSNTSWFFC
ncbi:class III lanthipeptide [Staphylococcus sp. SQ8-PEA]|uniref:Class III lanthipeptide n=1 Tax=Staphylococcus marylandisciuri TaxID=2981529 RepID=A0ABT2QSX8_9STAP|nr:class III lanthipeptide [Staphylococcus marylandisciuri]MCU5747089.1 class III lanthipeptide [Staphylococcus marylandisciuri]